MTLNSLGERAGNTSLEEVVMALRTRPHLFPVHCDIETKQIMRTSKMVATYTGIAVQASQPAPPLRRPTPRWGGRREAHPLSRPAAAPRRRAQANKAIVGANAFAHESGIHEHGVLLWAS